MGNHLEPVLDHIDEKVDELIPKARAMVWGASPPGSAPRSPASRGGFPRALPPPDPGTQGGPSPLGTGATSPSADEAASSASSARLLPPIDWEHITPGQDYAAQDWITVAQLIGMEQYSQFKLDITRVNILFVIDTDHTGRFTKKKLKDFARLVARLGYYDSYRLEARGLISAFCTLELWDCVSKENGQDLVVAWLLTLFCQIHPLIQHDGPFKSLLFLHESAISALYTVLRIENFHGMSYTQFFTTLQRDSIPCLRKAFQASEPLARDPSTPEAKSSQKIPDRGTDTQSPIRRVSEDSIPISVIQDFLSTYVANFVKLSERFLVDTS